MPARFDAPATPINSPTSSLQFPFCSRAISAARLRESLAGAPQGSSQISSISVHRILAASSLLYHPLPLSQAHVVTLLFCSILQHNDGIFYHLSRRRPYHPQPPPFSLSGRNRGRRPRTRVRRSLLHLVVTSPSSRSRRNAAAVDSLRALAGFLDGTLARRWGSLPVSSHQLDLDLAVRIESLRQSGIGQSGASIPHKIQRLTEPIRTNRYEPIENYHVSASDLKQIRIRISNQI
jgi:hypothetical protein